MLGWPLILFCLGAGFVLLFRGADWMVDGSSQIARRMGVGVLVIGLTVVAFGTSAPEIVVSALAAREGNADMSLGNVLGSNVANVGLVLGACAVVLPSVLEARLAFRELLWLFGSLALIWFFAWDLAITRLEGAFLLLGFVAYNANVILFSPRDVRHDPHETHPGRYPALRTVGGMAAIGLGAWLVVTGAEAGALRIGLPGSVVGLTVLAVGTSLPELAAGLGGAFKGEKDISLGNVVGSNVFNLLAVIGIVALIQPLDPGALPEKAAAIEQAFHYAKREDFYVVLAFSVAAVALPYLGRGSGGRAKGALLLTAYFAYSIWLFVTRQPVQAG